MPGNLLEAAFHAQFTAPPPMAGDGEAVRLVTDTLQQLQARVASAQSQRFFRIRQVNFFVSLGECNDCEMLPQVEFCQHL